MLLKSLDDGAVFGFYQPFYLFASITFPAELTAKPPEELRGVLTSEQLIGYALARYTFLHELRHFHDYFGTTAGISLFTAHLEQVRAFASFLEGVRGFGQELAFPFNPSSFSGTPLEDLAKGLVRNWRIFLRSTTTFVEAFERTIDVGHVPADHVVFKPREGNGPDVPTFPLQMGIGQHGRVDPVTVFYPIGLEVLLEGNAQALQRGLMEVECSPALADQLVPLMHHQKLGADDPMEALRAGAMPYNITDLLVSKFLRLKGHPRFQRSTILQLTDQALSWSFMRPRSKPWEVPATFELVDIGRTFVGLLEAAPLQNLVAGTVHYPDGLLDVYRTFLDAMSNTPLPEDIEYEGDLLSPIRMIESIVMHNIVKPLLKARLETKHEVFYSVSKYLEKIPDLPSVPVFLEGGSVRFASYMQSPKATDAWVKYCFLTSLMRELYASQSSLNCFRAQQLDPTDLNLCAAGHCNEHIARGSCSNWFPGSGLPVCSFANLLARVGLKP
ncbi:hypothetical protein [Bradyrhizobium sp. CCGUVB14]|uniref:hypothetical protein n=1 Tax=Bradyrhizobium sp. CCGUVB14 TaxID=2949628 RepID=UPI0020B1FE9C|nr:hypothetical protein [Bradyrhizobium sp. CCGUVB14]MCP3444541.1 hypothetical protein [Bradyrhizobium sp. CCGUVB14]